ncbi:MAG: hypothetical protein IKP68_02950 [Clostridia bacterium]|nr:hypothetical protein [Clostridia bacterium]
MLWFLPDPVRHLIEDLHLQAPVIITFFVLAFFLILKLRDVIRFAFVRSKIKRMLKKHGKCVKTVNLNAFFLGGKNKTDFYVITPKETLAVKVFGKVRRNLEYCFDDEGGYYTQKYISVPYARGIKLLPLGFGKKKILPVIDFTYRAKDLGIDEKSIVPAILFNPAPHLLTRGSDVENKVRDGKRWCVPYLFNPFENLNGMVVLDTMSLRSTFSCIETGVSPIGK